MHFMELEFHLYNILVISPKDMYDRGVVVINQSPSSATKSIPPLPTNYTNVPPATGTAH